MHLISLYSERGGKKVTCFTTAFSIIYTQDRPIAISFSYILPIPAGFTQLYTQKEYKKNFSCFSLLKIQNDLSYCQHALLFPTNIRNSSITTFHQYNTGKTSIALCRLLSDRDVKNSQYTDKHCLVKCHPNLLNLPKISVIAKTVPEPLIFRLLPHRGAVQSFWQL